MSGERPDGFYWVRKLGWTTWIVLDYRQKLNGDDVDQWGERIPDNDTLRRQRERLERLSESDPVEALSQLLEESGLEARLDADAWLQSLAERSSQDDAPACTECGGDCDGGWGQQCSRSCAAAFHEKRELEEESEFRDADDSHTMAALLREPAEDRGTAGAAPKCDFVDCTSGLCGSALCRRCHPKDESAEDRSQPPPGFSIEPAYGHDQPDRYWAFEGEDELHPTAEAAIADAWERFDAIAKPAYDRGYSEGHDVGFHNGRNLGECDARQAAAEELYDARAGNAQLHDELAQAKGEVERLNRQLHAMCKDRDAYRDEARANAAALKKIRELSNTEAATP